MSLLHPTVGEMIDRLSILDMKIAARPDYQHFQDERAELLARLEPVSPQLREEGLAALREVNRKIWTGNEIIALQLPCSGLAEWMWARNNERIRRIAEINKVAGERWLTEKVY